MESNLVVEFISETGASCVEAYNYLQAKGWDLQLAIHDYLLSKDDSLSSNRPLLMKLDSFDIPDSSNKKLARGISRAADNINLINKARSELGLDIQQNGVCNINQYFIETPVFTFTLPDLSIFPDDFREFLEKDLIETSSLLSLEQAGRLNWWADNGVCQRLWPLATTGDGNCLLHAASLGMWGFHDRLLTLRRALHDFLSYSSYKDSLWRRWRWQLTRLNAAAGLVYTEEEWRKEWESIVSMASSTPRNSGRRRSAVIDKSNSKDIAENATYESLEEIHVLALSHVLKRPIIVIADTVLKDVNGEALAPILFGGIYLPLEIPPSECHKSPLVLTFDAAHFSALVVMEKETFVDKSPHPPAVIPLTDSHHKLLPLQFSIDPGENFVWGTNENLSQISDKSTLNAKEVHFLLREYLDIVYVPLLLSPLSDDCELDLDLDTPCDEEDIEKRFIEANDFDFENNMPEIPETSLFGSNRSRAAKQMKNVAKQFGSIGKSMSKKLKKNLGTITKITRSSSQRKDAILQSRGTNEDLTRSQDYILSARLHTEERHEYQEEMIKNYLITARDRFEREKRARPKFVDEAANYEDEKLQEHAKLEGPKNCIVQGCNMYGTVLTSYLCRDCYEKQREEELSTNINSPSLPRANVLKSKTNSSSGSNRVDAPGYGTGRSTFYFEASPKSYENAKSFNMSSGKTLKPPDETIYLSNSTFYNDRTPQTGTSQRLEKDWKSSHSNLVRNTMPHPVRKETEERPKTWQEEIVNQIDGLGLLALSSETKDLAGGGDLTNIGNDFNKMGDEPRKSLVLSTGSGEEVVKKKIQSYNLVGDDIQTNAKSGNLSLLKDQLMSRGSPEIKNITISNLSSVQNKSKDLPDIENVTRPNSQSQAVTAKTVNNNLVTTIPIRQSSQNNLDDLIKEATEYFNKNIEGKLEPLGKVNVIPVESYEVRNVRNDNLDSTLSNGKLNVQYVPRKLCLNVTCKFFGSPELDNYCSQCYRGRYENLKFDSNSKK